jgi:electron transfer flavoprotein beta subunit
VSEAAAVLVIGVALQWADQRPDVDPLTGAALHDDRSAGLSLADQAALEWALRTGEAWDAPVRAVTAGSVDADQGLRLALAAGAGEAVRVECHDLAPAEVVARSLAPHLASCAVVWCGFHGSDRGSGAVPAFLAARLHVAQALGLIDVVLGEPGTVEATRRLDGGRRERLRSSVPLVASVEGATARLRRPSLSATVAASKTSIAVHPGAAGAGAHVRSALHPFRPRARVVPAPEGATALARIAALTTARSGSRTAGAPEVLEPDDAADRILHALASWGYDFPGSTDLE